MKLWIDDIRFPPGPPGKYVWIKSVNQAKDFIIKYSNSIDWDNNLVDEIELLDIDHDAGFYSYDGGDYIKLLDWLEENEMNYPIRIHCANPVGRENMRRVIQKNGWREVY